MTVAVNVDLLLAEPSGSKDEVVRFRVQFAGSPKVYSYAAVKAGSLWFVTGADAAQGKTWEGLMLWMASRGGEVIAMQHATAWEAL